MKRRNQRYFWFHIFVRGCHFPFLAMCLFDLSKVCLYLWNNYFHRIAHEKVLTTIYLTVLVYSELFHIDFTYMENNIPTKSPYDEYSTIG